MNPTKPVNEHMGEGRWGMPGFCSAIPHTVDLSDPDVISWLPDRCFAGFAWASRYCKECGVGPLTSMEEYQQLLAWQEPGGFMRRANYVRWWKREDADKVANRVLELLVMPYIAKDPPHQFTLVRTALDMAAQNSARQALERLAREIESMPADKPREQIAEQVRDFANRLFVLHEQIRSCDMSSSVWNHQICQECWDKRNPGRTTFRAVDDYQQAVQCCFCNAETKDGIVVRDKPEKVPCKGTEGQHAVDAKKTVAKC